MSLETRTRNSPKYLIGRAPQARDFYWSRDPMKRPLSAAQNGSEFQQKRLREHRPIKRPYCGYPGGGIFVSGKPTFFWVRLPAQLGCSFLASCIHFFVLFPRSHVVMPAMVTRHCVVGGVPSGITYHTLKSHTLQTNDDAVAPSVISING